MTIKKKCIIIIAVMFLAMLGVILLLNQAAHTTAKDIRLQGQYSDTQLSTMQTQNEILVLQEKAVDHQRFFLTLKNIAESLRYWFFEHHVTELAASEKKIMHINTVFDNKLNQLKQSNPALSSSLKKELNSFRYAMSDAYRAKLNGPIKKLFINKARNHFSKVNTLIAQELSSATREIIHNETQAKQLNQKLKTLSEKNNATIFDIKKNNNMILTFSYSALIIMSLACLAFVAFLHVIIIKPILKLGRHIQKITESSDLTLKIPVPSKDEIGDIAHHFNTMINGFLLIIKQTEETTATTAGLVNDTAGNIKKMHEEINAQHDETQSVTIATKSMTETIRDIAKNAENAAKTAEKTRTVAKEGYDIVKASMQGTQKLTTEVKKSSEAINRVSDSSENIKQVLNVICTIAEQTNLLALNAAIEAARAGDAGRGFAVVADEVRILAQRTNDSTGEIKNMIDSLSSSVSEAVDVMQEGVHSASEGLTKSVRASEALQSISESVNEISGMNAAIANAAEAQHQVTTHIADTIEKINTLASETAKRAHRTSFSTQDQVNLFSNLKASIDKFKVK